MRWQAAPVLTTRQWTCRHCDCSLLAMSPCYRLVSTQSQALIWDRKRSHIKNSAVIAQHTYIELLPALRGGCCAMQRTSAQIAENCEGHAHLAPETHCAGMLAYKMTSCRAVACIRGACAVACSIKVHRDHMSEVHALDNFATASSGSWSWPTARTQQSEC